MLKLFKAVMTMLVAGVLTLPASDTFNRNDSTLGSNWTGVSGAITDWVVCDSTICSASPNHWGVYSNYTGAEFAIAYWNADSFNADQYSQATVFDIGGTNGYVGLGVRISSGPNGYFFTLESSSCQMYKFVSGTRSTIGTCSLTQADGDVMKITAVGTTIKVYQNGVERGTATDSSVSSGSAGIIGYQSGTPSTYDWTADNISGGGGATFPAGILNNPIGCCDFQHATAWFMAHLK